MLRRNAGFTLIEIMIVVVVVAILATIAYPSYREQVFKSRRAEAKAALYNWAQALERCYTQYGAYDNANCSPIGADGDFDTQASEGNLYQVTGVAAGSTFTLTAAPTAGGPQANDAKCATLTLNQAHQKGATGTSPSDCW
jgi:type IV pilus assembly protein PilE